MTEWRVLNWLTGYEVSEDGRLRRTVTVRNHPAGRELVGHVNRDGYRVYTARCGRGFKPLRAHRLVCEAWHGPAPFLDAHVAHWDGDKRNNHYANLRWVTPAENALDMIRHGRICWGEKSTTAQLTWAQVDFIRGAGRDIPGIQLARQLGVTNASISNIRLGRTWKEAFRPSEAA